MWNIYTLLLYFHIIYLVIDMQSIFFNNLNFLAIYDSYFVLHFDVVCIVNRLQKQSFSQYFISQYVFLEFPLGCFETTYFH